MKTVDVTPEQRVRLWEQACRSKWRALHLSIKAKFVAVEAGIETVEEAFLAQVVMADGKTVYQHVLEPIAASYDSGRMQPLVPAHTGKGRS